MKKEEEFEFTTKLMTGALFALDIEEDEIKKGHISILAMAMTLAILSGMIGNGKGGLLDRMLHNETASDFLPLIFRNPRASTGLLGDIAPFNEAKLDAVPMLINVVYSRISSVDISPESLEGLGYAIGSTANPSLELLGCLGVPRDLTEKMATLIPDGLLEDCKKHRLLSFRSSNQSAADLNGLSISVDLDAGAASAAELSDDGDDIADYVAPSAGTSELMKAKCHDYLTMVSNVADFEILSYHTKCLYDYEDSRKAKKRGRLAVKSLGKRDHNKAINEDEFGLIFSALTRLAHAVGRCNSIMTLIANYSMSLERPGLLLEV